MPDSLNPRTSSHEAGEGEPVVLLHGLGGTWDIWKPVIPLLAPHLRVIALTLPGHLAGPELAPGATPTTQSLADALERELDARGLATAHFVGNSLGGLMSLEMARRGRARSVTAFSPAGAWREPKDFQAVARQFRIIFALLWLLMLLTTLFLRFAGVRRAINAQAMEHGDRMPEHECRGAMESLRKTRMLPALLTSLGEAGSIQPLQAGDVPIRIAWCEHDKVIPFETYGRPMVDAVQGAQLLTVRGAGHVPMYDDPEQVANIVLATVASVEKSPA